MDPGLTGRCDVCQYNNVKVSPLTCMRHFCCLTCQKFAKTSKDNLFACSVCEREQRQVQAERRRHSRILDLFIEDTATERRSRLFKDVPITMSGSQVINLQEDHEDEDLSGNNEEWDELINSLTYEPSCAEKNRVPSRAERVMQKNKNGNKLLTNGIAKCNLDSKQSCGLESPIRLPPEDKFSEESRIYDWCVAAEKSLSAATKSSSGRFEDSMPFRNACPSSSSENSLSKKKFQQQCKNKELKSKVWWDNQSDSDSAEWDECFSKPGPFFKMTSEKGQPFHKPVGENNMNIKDEIINFDLPPSYPTEERFTKDSPITEVSSHNHFSLMSAREGMKAEPSVSPLDLGDKFWDQ